MTSSHVYAGFALLFLNTASCAHAPPRELTQAREAYREAAQSVAVSQAPTQLRAADKALAAAEASYAQRGDREHTRDLAYVALRKAQVATVDGRVRYNQSRLVLLEAAAEEQERAELTVLREQNAQQQRELELSQAALAEASERADRTSLEQIATVVDDQRGTVMRLSAEVLFRSNKAVLAPGAEAKLDRVARALTEQKPDAQVVVEGFTDSQGSDSYNLELSRLRAEAVRAYLTARGVAEDRISAKGMGEAQPVGNNGTREGRAINRRVEVVLQPSS
jgi:outer membrane protein OmpA-like peptidoglycan-associated protein